MPACGRQVFTRKDYSNLVIESLQYCQKDKGLEIFAWCIMSNHVHLIARAKDGFLLQNIMRDFKKFTSKKIIDAIANHTGESRKSWMLKIFKKCGEANSNNKIYQFWRQDNHPIEIITKNMFDQKLNYIHQNPVEAGIVDKQEEYINSSARDYFEGENVGKLKIKWY